MSSKRAKNTAEILANFISRVWPEDISPEIRDLAKLHLLDGIATMIGSLGQGASRHILCYVSASGTKKECSVIGTRIKVSAPQAALVNGVQGHVLDFDDSQLATLPSRPFGQQTHPTSPVLAAALAVAEKLRSSPSALLTSYVVRAAPDADAILISCGNLRSFEVIESLETDTGLPVVTCNQAGLWQALRLIGIRSPLPWIGRLLRDF